VKKLAKKVKLFGYNLTETSALLLFIFSATLVALGLFGVVMEIEYFDEWEDVSPALLIVYSSMIAIGSYILIKTVRFKKT